MAQPSDLISIKLQLGFCILPLDVPRDEEYYYREAAKHVAQKYAYYANRFPSQTKDMFLTLTALDVAVTLIKLSKNTEEEEMSKVLTHLISEVESIIK